MQEYQSSKLTQTQEPIQYEQSEFFIRHSPNALSHVKKLLEFSNYLQLRHYAKCGIARNPICA
jgi:hypothetical protein